MMTTRPCSLSPDSAIPFVAYNEEMILYAE
jgi:hypothetical protein